MADLQAQPLHGGQLRQIAERFGISRAGLLDFSANINPEGAPASALAVMRAGLEVGATVSEYPDMEQRDLKKSLAVYAGTDEAHVVVANGFGPLLEAALRALGVRRCLLPVPAFVEYRKTLERLGIAVVAHELKAESGFAYDPRAMLAVGTEAVLLANPQNPSGVCHNFRSMCELVAQAGEKGRYVLLDEAFVDYVPGDSLVRMIDQFPHLIVFRSVTKFYAMPGLRVAYAVTHSRLAAAMGEQLAPWPITTLASLAVSAAVGDEEYAVKARSENLARREALEGELRLLGLQVYTSTANFLLFRIAPAIDAEMLWRELITKHGIVLRACANYEGLATGHFRAAVRAESENKRLVRALAATLAELQASEAEETHEVRS